MKKLKTYLCLFLSFVMIFGGTQTWAASPNDPIGDNMAKINWSGNDNYCRVTAINGNPVSGPQDYNNKEFPVGTTFTLQADPSYESQYGGQEQTQMFFKWTALVVNSVYEDPVQDSSSLENQYARETTLTITKNMAGKSVLLSAQYTTEDLLGKIPINAEWIYDYTPCNIVSYTGDVDVYGENGTYFSSSAGVGSTLTFKVTEPTAGASYRWFLFTAGGEGSIGSLVQYFPGENGDTFTLEVTQEMMDSYSGVYPYKVSAVQWDHNDSCEVMVGGGKIISADGVPVSEGQVTSFENETYLNNIGGNYGSFAPGTVLEIQADNATNLWEQLSNIPSVPRAALFRSTNFVPGKGEITTVSDTMIKYVVPDQGTVLILPGDADNLFTWSYALYDIDNAGSEGTTPDAQQPPETSQPEVPQVTPEREVQVKAFAQRLYENILQRSADQTGLDQWADVLLSGQESGAKVAQGFVDSDEFKARNLSDEEYIKILYRAFLGREADTAGLSAWLDVLDSGLSRMHVFKGFAESDEFTNICNNYGIIRGNAVLTAPMDQNEGVTKFVARCYELCLGRKADTNGINAWCNQILTGANTAKQAAYGFVFSNEFKAKNLSNEEYVKTLYRVFMDREADPEGLGAWIGVLESGQSREHVFDGFADSPEFREICAGYGIQ